MERASGAGAGSPSEAYRDVLKQSIGHSIIGNRGFKRKMLFFQSLTIPAKSQGYLEMLRRSIRQAQVKCLAEKQNQKENSAQGMNAGRISTNQKKSQNSLPNARHVGIVKL